MVSAHIFVVHSNDSIACSFQQLSPCAVIGLSSSSVVHTPLELDNEAFARAVKVHDEPVQHVLPAELQPEYPPIAQQRPSMTLGGSRPMAQCASERESLRWPEATKRIHRARMPPRPHVKATRIPRRENKRRSVRTFLASPLSRRERGTGGEDKTTRGDHEACGEDQKGQAESGELTPRTAPATSPAPVP